MQEHRRKFTITTLQKKSILGTINVALKNIISLSWILKGLVNFKGMKTRLPMITNIAQHDFEIFMWRTPIQPSVQKCNIRTQGKNKFNETRIDFSSQAQTGFTLYAVWVLSKFGRSFSCK